MIDPKLQAAYDACAKEPIQLSGAIQPHGVLLAYAPRSGRIVAASDNVEGLFGTKAAELLGQPIAELFDAHAMQLIQAHAMACQPGDFPRLAGMINAGEWGELHHLSVHVWNQLIHVELEPAEREKAEPVDAHAMIAKLETGEKSAPFFEAVAQQVHELTGYDRVMVYAFRHDHSGEVVAQALGGAVQRARCVAPVRRHGNMGAHTGGGAGQVHHIQCHVASIDGVARIPAAVLGLALGLHQPGGPQAQHQQVHQVAHGERDRVAHRELVHAQRLLHPCGQQHAQQREAADA